MDLRDPVWRFTTLRTRGFLLLLTNRTFPGRRITHCLVLLVFLLGIEGDWEFNYLRVGHKSGNDWMGHREAEGAVGILDGLVLALLLLALLLSFALEDPSVPLPLPWPSSLP